MLCSRGIYEKIIQKCALKFFNENSNNFEPYIFQIMILINTNKIIGLEQLQFEVFFRAKFWSTSMEVLQYEVKTQKTQTIYSIK